MILLSFELTGSSIWDTFVNSMFGIFAPVKDTIGDAMGNFYDAVVAALTIISDHITGTIHNIEAVTEVLFTSVNIASGLHPYIWAPIASSMLIVILIAIGKTVLGWGNT